MPMKIELTNSEQADVNSNANDEGMKRLTGPRSSIRKTSFSDLSDPHIGDIIVLEEGFTSAKNPSTLMKREFLEIQTDDDNHEDRVMDYLDIV
jgi:hypothetical protein